MSAPSTLPPRNARIAISVIFLINGVGWANWIARIPAVQAHLGLSAGGLGLALWGGALGAVSGLPLASWLIARFGSQRITRISSLAFCAALPIPALADNPLLLFLGLALTAGSSAVMDVAMNTQAVAVEERYHRPIMSAFHGLFSVGGMVGAAIGGLIAQLGIDALPHLLGVALVLAVVVIFATRWLLPVAVDRTSHGPAFARPSRALLGLGVIAFCAVLGEGVMADWSAVYLSHTLNTSAGLAAAGYAVFSLAMAVGRLTGDRLNQRLGPVALVRGGGLLAAFGLGLALLVAQPVAALLGFACVGAGLSTIFPITISAAGRTLNLAPGTAVAAIATTAYAGFLVGPPLIGFTADQLTLRLALTFIVLTSAAIALFASAVGRAGRSPLPTSGEDVAAFALEDAAH